MLLARVTQDQCGSLPSCSSQCATAERQLHLPTDDGRQLAERAEWERCVSETTFLYDAAGSLVEGRDTGDSENRTLFESDAAGNPIREALHVAAS